MIEKVIGFIFICFGILECITDKLLCAVLCPTCNSEQLSPCFFLFLFVGIIFILCGYSLIIMKEEKSLPKFRLKK